MVYQSYKIIYSINKMLPIVAAVLIFLWLSTPSSRIGIDPQGTEIFHGKSSAASRPSYYNRIYTGQKHECVEYARRWLVKNRGVTFDRVETATDILSLRNARRLSDSALLPLVPVTVDYRVGDLVVFPPTEENSGYGHVAVIVRVLSDRVQIGEQNYSNKKWKRDYSRELSLEELKNLNVRRVYL
jgi:hypothetical protein